MTPFDRMRWDAARRDLAAAVYQLSIEVRNRDMSITGYKPGAIRAAIDAAKRQSQKDLSDAMGDLAKANAMAAEVPAAIKDVANKIKKEAADAMQELAEFTNGGPPLDDPQPEPTPLPTVTFAPQMTVLSEIPPALKGRGNAECIPIKCCCGETFLFPASVGRTVACPACHSMQTFAADDASFNVIHNGQAK